MRRTSLSIDRAGLENVLIRGVSAISVPTFQQCSNNSLLFTCLRRVEGVPVGRARCQRALPALAAGGVCVCVRDVGCAWAGRGRTACGSSMLP